MSLAFISSTISQRTRASGDVAPYFLLASSAASTAAELSAREKREVGALLPKGTGAKADVELARSARVRSFMANNISHFLSMEFYGFETGQLWQLDKIFYERNARTCLDFKIMDVVGCMDFFGF